MSRDKIKVLYIPLWYPDEDTREVSGVFNREHVIAMKPYVDVSVLHFKTDLSRRGMRMKWSIKEEQGVPVHRAETGLSPVPKTSFITWKVQLYRAVNRYIHNWGKPDIIHAQDDNSWVIAYLAQRHNLPFVLSQHWNKVLGNRLSPWEKWLYKRTFKRAKAVLPAHYNAKEEYRAMGLEAHVIWLPNVFDPSLFHTAPTTKDKTLVHISGFTHQKRVGDILEAFALVLEEEPEARMIFVGDGPKRARYISLAEQLLPEGSYQFTGFLDKEAIAGYLQKCRGFVFPSSFETFGCVLMEAMACGVPVLTTREGGIPGVVRNDSYGILVEVGDIQCIKKGMIDMLRGAHGLDLERIAGHVNTQFSYASVGRQLRDIYQGIVDGKER